MPLDPQAQAIIDFVVAAGFGDLGPGTDPVAMRTLMDQAAMGTNFQVGALPRDKTPAADRFIGRLSYLLQHGRRITAALREKRPLRPRQAVKLHRLTVRLG